MQINELLLKNFGKFHDRQIRFGRGDQPDPWGKRIRKIYDPYIHQRGMLFGIERGEDGGAK